MGVSTSFVSATTEEPDRAEQDPSWADQFHGELYSGDLFPVPGRLYGGPDRDFAGLQFLFDEAELSLEFVMDGIEATYEELVAFFGEAADRGLGAFMNFSF